MFRYMALAWDEAGPATSIRAHRLATYLQALPGWQTALCRPGLQVHTVGTRPGINGSYPLDGDRGVVLGKLFRRRGLHSPATGDITLTGDEKRHVRDTRGRSLVSDFWGRYVAFCDMPDSSTCVLRDPSGTLPCFLVRHAGITIVFSWLEDLLELLADSEVRFRPNPDAVAALLVSGVLGGRVTGLEGVSQVLAGEAVDLRTEASCLYWRAVDIARVPSPIGFTEAEVLLRKTVRSCTRLWAACHDTLLLRLSGGVDSSILLSCLAPGQTSADVICLNYHSPGSDSDERGYARLAAGRFGRDLIERERNAGFRIECLTSAARMPVPINHIGWMNAETDARLASAHGASAMFTGAGGDPLFFEFRRWWPATDYLQTRGLDGGFAAAAIDAARLGRVSVWTAVARAAAERVRPRVAQQEAEHPASHFFGEALRPLMRPRNRFVHPDLRDPRLPPGKFMQTASLMYPLVYYDPFEQARAPELVNPLLSQPLVELCLGLPTYLLTQGGVGRALARRAFAAELPRRIATRRSKGGIEDHLKDILRANLDFAKSVLLDGELVRQRWLNRGALEAVLDGQPTSMPGSLGHLHAFIGIELWLARLR